jgi:REP element-mobilizing transposase RayT
MSVHSYTRCWVHLIWGTLNRERLLNKAAAARISDHLTEYAEKKGIYMKINHVNAHHVRALVDLPTAISIEEVTQLLKGSSSHWINANDITTGKFAWGRVMVRSLCQNRTWIRSLDTLHIRKNTTTCERSQRSSKSSPIAMDCDGEMRKAVKTASKPTGTCDHRPQGRC